MSVSSHSSSTESSTSDLISSKLLPAGDHTNQVSIRLNPHLPQICLISSRLNNCHQNQVFTTFIQINIYKKCSATHHEQPNNHKMYKPNIILFLTFLLYYSLYFQTKQVHHQTYRFCKPINIQP